MDVAKEIELLREVHYRARQLMRYNGIDKDRANAAYDALKEAVHTVNDYDNQD